MPRFLTLDSVLLPGGRGIRPSGVELEVADDAPELDLYRASDLFRELLDEAQVVAPPLASETPRVEAKSEEPKPGFFNRSKKGK